MRLYDSKAVLQMRVKNVVDIAFEIGWKIRMRIAEVTIKRKLSFIIPAYNCEVSLFECIDGIGNNIQD